MLQESLFRVAGMAGDKTAQLFSDLPCFGSGLGKDGINNLGHLPAQRNKVLIGPTPLLGGPGGGAVSMPGTAEFQHLGARGGHCRWGDGT